MSDVPLLSCSEAIEKLKSFREKLKEKQEFLAMYSSIFGGITTDPVAMVIPMDDHMVHRGHGVFDTTAIVDGYLYELDQHLNRFLRAASMAKINFPFDRSTIRTILIKTVTASNCKNGSIKYFLSSGPGNFDLSPIGCYKSSPIVTHDMSLLHLNSKGVKVVTTSIPIKPPKFANIKCVNYLPNVLSKMEAEEFGAFAGIWVDSEGFVAEGPSMNVAFVSKENELVMPQYEKILKGCTVKIIMTLAEDLVREGKIKGVRVKNVSVEEGKNAEEMMLLGGEILVRSVVQWDEQIIGNGKEGPITEALLNLVIQDMKSAITAVGIPVPY